MRLSNSEHRAKKEIPALPMAPVKQYECIATYPSPTASTEISLEIISNLSFG